MPSSIVNFLHEFSRLNAIKKLILLTLMLAAMVSVAQGVMNARRSSQDFQWSPSLIFLQGDNPYQVFLDGDKNRRIILTQGPNYAHALYSLLTPIAALNWGSAKIVWALLNVIASVIIAVFLSRRAGLSANLTLLVLLVFLCSTPFRSGISNGQQATFTLAAFCATLFETRATSYLWAGLGYLKYSFAPPLAFYIWFRKGFKMLGLSLIPFFVGYLIFLARVGGDPLTVLVQPLQVAMRAVSFGTADLMSLGAIAFPSKTGKAYLLVTYMLPLLIGAGVAFAAVRYVKNDVLRFAVICLTPLFLFKHLPYDFIFLLPAFICSVAYMHEHRGASLSILSVVLIDWFGLMLFDNLYTKHGHPLNTGPFVAANFVLCLLMTVSLFWIGLKSTPLSRTSV